MPDENGAVLDTNGAVLDTELMEQFWTLKMEQFWTQFWTLSYTRSEFTISLYCTSTGLPPTTVTWRKDGVEMSSGDSYSFSQRVIDVDNTVYENMVIVNRKSAYDMQGLYQCSVQCLDDLGDIVNSANDSLHVTGESGQVNTHA